MKAHLEGFDAIALASSGPLDAASTRERNWPGHGGLEIGDERGRRTNEMPKPRLSYCAMPATLVAVLIAAKRSVWSWSPPLPRRRRL